MTSDPRIAFVLDTLPSIGGGEKVLVAALEAYPHADIFTLIYNKASCPNSGAEEYHRILTAA